jgi:hypothetical protein
LPSSSRALTSEPRSTRSFTISMSPLAAASCSAASPSP